MDAPLGSKVYLSNAGAGESDGSFDKRLLLPNQGQHAPVVVGVGVEVENANAADGSDGIGYPGYFFGVATLAEVGDNLKELGWHGAFLTGAQGPVEVDRGRYEGEVCEGLGEVTQGLAGGSYLLGVEAEVVGVGEHLLQSEAGVV